MSDNYAVIYKGVVESIAMWDGISDWKPEANRTLQRLRDDSPVQVGWTYRSGQFEAPLTPVEMIDVESLRENKLDIIAKACAVAITSGFVSTALGKSYTYPSKVTDQANLTASVVDSLLSKDENWQTPFWCTDSDNVSQYRMHNKDQIQKVGQDAKSFILDTLVKKDQLENQIKVAETREQLNVIVW
ncbi:tail fiber protein [Pseudomonas phage vB_PpuM-Aura]